MLSFCLLRWCSWFTISRTFIFSLTVIHLHWTRMPHFFNSRMPTLLGTNTSLKWVLCPLIAHKHSTMLYCVICLLLDIKVVASFFSFISSPWNCLTLLIELWGSVLFCFWQLEIMLQCFRIVWHLEIWVRESHCLGLEWAVVPAGWVIWAVT